MALALNNLQTLIFKETKPTKQVQCNPDIRELSRPENKSLIFGLFCFGNPGSNLEPEKMSLISGFILYQGFSYISVTLNNPPTNFIKGENNSVVYVFVLSDILKLTLTLKVHVT